MTDAITRAIALIEEGAAELQLSHTRTGDRNNWTDEDDARAVFDEHVAVAVALLQLRAELDALKEKEPVVTKRKNGIVLHAGWDDLPEGAKLYAAPVPSVPHVTEEMITAYLTANDAYWKECDELPKSPVKWRRGTPSEATRISLEAALAAAPKPEDVK